jgi:transcription elongation GreA/GreB family factor
MGAQLMRMMVESAHENNRVDGSSDVTIDRLQAATGKLGLIASGLAMVDPGLIPPQGAGYGSDVKVINMDTGMQVEYTLMLSAQMDVRGNHVSLASPVGQALLGAVSGDETMIVTPHRNVSLRVVDVRTLIEMLNDIELEFLNC